jgi:hypothetical protein
MVTDHGEKSALFSKSSRKDLAQQWVLVYSLTFRLLLFPIPVLIIVVFPSARKKLTTLFLISPMTKLLVLMVSTTPSSKKLGTSSGMTYTSFVRIYPPPG